MAKTLEMKLKITLVKKELPKSIDTPAGINSAKYYVQYLSSDDYLLAEREATSFDMDLFNRFGKKL